MRQHKVFIVGGDYLIEAMYHQKGWEVVDTMEDADVVQFTGGEDVSTELYGEKNVRSYCDAERDNFEQKIFDQAYKLGKFMVGICRGGQFLNVMNGGKMWQHVTGHTVGHLVYTNHSERPFKCTSTHHQMMRPSSAGQIIGWVPRISDIYQNAEGIVRRGDGFDDVEVVWYDVSNCLCFQPHPEYHKDETRELFWLLMEEYYENLYCNNQKH